MPLFPAPKLYFLPARAGRLKKGKKLAVTITAAIIVIVNPENSVDRIKPVLVLSKAKMVMMMTPNPIVSR